MNEVEAARHAEARGLILRTLREDYAAEMTSVGSLGHALDAMGVSLSPASLTFHLVYLCDQGYIHVWRGRDMPFFRPDRRGALWVDPAAIVFVKLLPKGVQLIDGDIEADPKVTF